MSAPTTPIPNWSSNANYAAGSETGHPTTSTPTSGRIADGFSPETKPIPQEFNWLIQVICQWLTYFSSAITALASYSTVKGLRLKDLLYSTGTAASEAGFGTAPSRMVVAVNSGGPATSAYFDLGPSPTTDKLVGFSVEVVALGGSPVLAVYKINEGGTSGNPGLTEPVLVAEKTVTATGIITMDVAPNVVPTAFALAAIVPAGAGVTIGSVHLSWLRVLP